MMCSTLRLGRSAASLGVTSLVALAAACGGGGGDGGDAVDAAVDAEVDAFVIPVLRNAVSLPDSELATQASNLLGIGGSKNCDRCHALTRDRLRSWESETAAATASCLTNLTPTTPAEAQAIIDCFRATPGVAASGWPPHRLGIYNVAARLPWFTYVFRLGFGSEADAQLDAFVGEAAMPRGDGPGFTQAEWDIVGEWFARGLPRLDVVVPADPPPQTCTTNITPEIATHVNAMRTQGWRARNKEGGILMFGCQGATNARDCLASYPRPDDNAFSTGWEAAFPAGKLRILRTNTYRSSYWTRSSADGRYVSHGGSATGDQTYRSTVIDLQNDREIPAAALYDPGFFPDNSGFVIQGSNARFCEQSLLNSEPAMITFNEPQCRRNSAVGLYQHLGAAPGGDYWTVDGQFDNDNGGQGQNATLNDTPATFDANAEADLTPMVHEGTQFVPRPTITKPTPYEGDIVISPSARLLISRLDGPSQSSGTIGYLFRKIVATPNAAGSYDITIPEIARYCIKGGKPALSYDERWMVFHHYVEANDWQSLGYASATDPGFVALRSSSTGGAANIFLMELTTGEVRRITTMQPGQYALYPHFRSDGWIYFIVRDRNRGGDEYIVASDAALTLEN
ncbi:MAG TPA: hypothetical protein VM734_32235 [Kofleriaceae bacterium]|nr:hypothetical protein [Kofleriaceae bacterium]